MDTPKNDTDLNDSLDGLFGGAKIVGPAKVPPASYTPRTVEKIESYAEGCKKCGGSGQFVGYTGRVLGPCFACKGQGGKSFKTSPEARAKSREYSIRRAEVKAEEKGRELGEFVAAHEAEMVWLRGAANRNAARNGNFGFPQAMLDAVGKYAHLTDNQLAAVRKLMAADAQRKVEAQARQINAPSIDVSKIEAAFDRARSDAQGAGAEGVRWLKLRLDTFEFLDMPARGQWKAAIRVTEGEVKLGRIVDGKLQRSPVCTDEQVARIVAAAADPEAAARAYGLRFSSCSCCGKELTNPESIELGIGPICREKWFCG